METTFKVNTKEFAEAIKRIAKLIPATKKEGTAKITVQPTNIVISCPGIEQIVSAETEGLCDVRVPFNMLLGITKMEKNENTTLIIKDGAIAMGGYEFKSPEIKLTTIFSEEEIDLSLNYTPLDLFRLRNSYVAKELEKNKLLDRIEKAERRLEHDILHSLEFLQKYRITRSDLYVLIEKYIRNNENQELF